MKLWDRHAKMDEMETLNYQGWQFLCAGEQLPSGLFHASVRHRSPKDNELHTLQLDREKFGTAHEALARAKALAIQWADEHDPPQ